MTRAERRGRLLVLLAALALLAGTAAEAWMDAEVMRLIAL